MISRPRLYLYRLISGLLLLSFWELSSGRLIDPFWVSSPSAVFKYLYGVIADGSIFGHLAITIYETFSGFFIGAIFGIGLGFALVFFFSSRRRHTRLTCDWSSDVCSS